MDVTVRFYPCGEIDLDLCQKILCRVVEMKMVVLKRK